MRVLAIRHIPREGAGTLETFLSKRKISLNYWDIAENPSEPSDLLEYDCYVILGGPMGVYEEDTYPFIRKEVVLIQTLIAAQKPMLGICLGSQLIAKALGADVRKGPKKEIGWYGVALTQEGREDTSFAQLLNSGRAFPSDLTVFQWHGDTYDLPQGASELAYSALYRYQAFRYGTCVYGLQFHIEMTERMIREWITAGADELVSVKKGIDPSRILKDSPVHLSELQKKAFHFYEAFFEKMGSNVGPKERSL